MTDKPRRRWFAFSLRTLFVLVTLACLWLGWQVHIVRARKNFLNACDSYYLQRGPVDPRGCSVPWQRAILGDRPMCTVFVPWERRKEAKFLFPEAKEFIYVYGSETDP